MLCVIVYVSLLLVFDNVGVLPREGPVIFPGSTGVAECIACVLGRVLEGVPRAAALRTRASVSVIPVRDLWRSTLVCVRRVRLFDAWPSPMMPLP